MFAQNGTISGTVTEKANNAVVIGAIVRVDSTTAGAQSDFDGKFNIKIKEGTYSVTCKYFGYAPVTIRNVKVLGGKTTNISFQLEPESKLVGADSSGFITIYDSRPTNTQFSVLEDIKEGNVAADGQGQTEIKQSTATDASQVARRIPGVTVVDNRFVVVRGLSERYNAVLLNNLFAPSVESDVKAFSFDLVPSQMIDRFMIYKSPSPDLPGEFAGGVIKISTTDIPSQTSLQINYSNGFRSGTTFDPFSLNKGTSADFFAMGASSRALPAGVPGNVRDAINDPAAQEAAGKSLRNDWGYTTKKAPLDQRFNMTWAQRVSKPKYQFGNITSLNYSYTYQHLESQRLDYNIYDSVNQQSDTVFNYSDAIYTARARVALVQNNAFRFGKDGTQRITLKNLINQMGDNETTLRTGKNIEEGDYRIENSYRYTQRTLFTSQLGGEHIFNKERTTIDWTVGYSAARRNEPDWRRVRRTKPFSAAPEEPYQLYLPFSAQPFFLGRLFIDMNEDIYAGAANMQHIITIGADSTKGDKGYSFTLKGGFYYEQKDRVFGVRNLGYALGNPFSFNWDLLSLPVDSVFLPENINNTTGIKLDEDTKKADSYYASNTLQAGYAMAIIPVGKFKGSFDGEEHERIRISGGVRAERNIQRLNSNTIPGDTVIVNNDILRFLPSVNIAYNLTDRMLIRTAYGKTLNRPEFREIAPLYFYDFIFNSINSGNDSLKTPSIDNYDLRWEYYPRPGENITLGVFYKRFENPIETYFVPGVGSGGTRSFTWDNAPLARNYGFEIEVRKKLDSLNVPVIRNLAVVANAAFIKSAIDLSSANIGEKSNQRPMMGQSPWIVNAGLFYQNDSIGLTFNVMYNVIGPRVVIVGIPDIPEVYEMPRHQVDLAIIKTIGKRKNVDLRMNISDLLNQEFLLLQDANNNGKLERDADQRMQSFKRGTYITFGINVRLLEPKTN
ncbi:MAG: TonB-dependent receptor [Bacteroidia bacterium]